MKQKTRILVECAVMLALSTALSMVKVYEAPLGGSVTLFSMVPIIMASLRWGSGWGVFTAFAHSVIQLILGLGSVAYVPDVLGIIGCVMLDYILAFSVLGLSSLFSKMLGAIKNRTLNIALSATIVCALRFICHFLCGAVVWYSITKTGGWNDLVMRTGMWTYSFLYNISYMGPEIILTVISAPVVDGVLKRIDKTKSTNNA